MTLVIIIKQRDQSQIKYITSLYKKVREEHTFFARNVNKGFKKEGACQWGFEIFTYLINFWRLFNK